MGETNIQELQERSLRGTDWCFQGGECGVDRAGWPSLRHRDVTTSKLSALDPKASLLLIPHTREFSTEQ